MPIPIISNRDLETLNRWNVILFIAFCAETLIKYWLNKLLFLVYCVTALFFAFILLKKQKFLQYLLNLALLACAAGEVIYLFEIAKKEKGTSFTVNTSCTFLNVCFLILIYCIVREIFNHLGERYHRFIEHMNEQTRHNEPLMFRGSTFLEDFEDRNEAGGKGFRGSSLGKGGSNVGAAGVRFSGKEKVNVSGNGQGFADDSGLGGWN